MKTRDTVGAMTASDAAARALAELSQRFHGDCHTKILASLPGAVFTFGTRPDGTAWMPSTSPAVEELFGISQGELAEDTSGLFHRMHPDDAREVGATIEESARTLTPWYGLYRYEHPTRGLRWIEGWSQPSREPDGTTLWHGFVMDVTARKAAELRAERLSMIYRLLSGANAALARLTDADELFRVLCDLVLGLGSTVGVAVAMADPATNSLVARAHAGPALAGVERLVLPIAHEPQRGALASRAFRTGETLVEHDLRAVIDLTRWRHDAGLGLVASGVALPLRRRGEVVGVMAIASSELGYFDPEIVELLEHLSLGISHFLERQERAQELFLSEERFRGIFEQSVVGLVIVESPSGRVIRANERFCEIVGRTAEDLTTRTLVELVHPDDRPASLAFAAGDRSAERPTIEVRFVHEDGATVWANVAATRVVSADGTRRYGIASVEDITTRKRAEQALRESEERYRNLLENLDELIYCIDPEGRFTYLSRGLQTYGWSPDELLGADFLGPLVEEDRARAVDAHRRALAGEHVDPFEFRVVDARGKTRHIRTTIRAQIEGGRRVGVTGITFDLTTQREVEEQLRLAQKMEAVGRLAGGIAHDFNNLLSVIHSYTEIALESVPATDPLHDDLEEIWAASRRAEALTRQLLSFSRKQNAKTEVLDPNALIAGTEKMLRRVIGEDITLDVDLGRGAGTVEADHGQLEQILLNLSVNARDAMPDGGTLSITTSGVALDAAAAERLGVAPGPHFKLSVGDTGHGMDARTMSRIFEPFFTTKGRDQGTGLGLATTYAIVRRSGGGITVESRPGKGTRFDIFLPQVGRGAHLEAPSSRAAAPEGGTETLLVVEDDDAVRNLARRILGQAGYHVLLAPNAGEALLLFERRERDIALVITDVVMPGMNGRALVERLRGLRPELKVLYVSGYVDGILTDGGSLGPNTEFLGKPFTAESLQRTVRELLDGPPAARPPDRAACDISRA